MDGRILLGTVAIEPARWARREPPSGAAGERQPIVLIDWMDSIAAAGFDGIELWEQHLLSADPVDRRSILEHDLPIDIWNSYASLDDDDPAQRSAIGAHAAHAGAHAIKYNVGNDLCSLEAYAERIASWLDDLPDSIRLLCECHHDISIAERPEIAATIFDRAGPASRVQAIVHTHEADDQLRARFDAYGDRISHVHVNFLDFNSQTAPPLSLVADRLESRVELLSSLGFGGSWTIEFCHGLMTSDDRPAFLIQQAAADLVVLRAMIGSKR